MCKAKYVHNVKIIMFILTILYLKYSTLGQYNRFFLKLRWVLLYYMSINIFTHLTEVLMETEKKTAKSKRLKNDGVLHPNPDKVQAGLFAGNEFFDPHDLVQVKYEMLRCVRKEKCSVRGAARMFGLSRPSFYQARSQFEKEGVAGLLPRKRGPKEAHKLTEDVRSFVKERLKETPGKISWKDLSQEIEERFTKKVHPRSIERSMKQRKKGGKNDEQIHILLA